MPATARLLGSIIRWLLRKCKTRLKDEIDGITEPILLKRLDTDLESYILGVSFVSLLLCAFILIGRLFYPY